MQHYLYMNFYIIEGVVGLLSIGAILAECIAEVRRAKQRGRKLAEAIRDSHRLTAEGMSRDDVKRKIKMMRGLMKNGK